MLQKHSKSRETPFVIYVGLLLFAKTRKRQLIDIYNINMAFAYHMTVLEIPLQMGEALVESYLEEVLVFPSILRKGLLTTAAVDNIDHNSKVIFSWLKPFNISTPIQ